MRVHVVQGVVSVPALGSQEPGVLFALPVGFRGYARVKFLGAAAGDFLYGMWFPISGTELRPQNLQMLSGVNYGVHFSDDDEKLWEFACEGRAFAVICSASGGNAAVDVCGMVEEHDKPERS